MTQPSASPKKKHFKPNLIIDVQSDSGGEEINNADGMNQFAELETLSPRGVIVEDFGDNLEEHSTALRPYEEDYRSHHSD